MVSKVLEILWNAAGGGGFRSEINGHELSGGCPRIINEPQTTHFSTLWSDVFSTPLADEKRYSPDSRRARMSATRSARASVVG